MRDDPELVICHWHAFGLHLIKPIFIKKSCFEVICLLYVIHRIRYDGKATEKRQSRAVYVIYITQFETQEKISKRLKISSSVDHGLWKYPKRAVNWNPQSSNYHKLCFLGIELNHDIIYVPKVMGEHWQMCFCQAFPFVKYIVCKEAWKVRNYDYFASFLFPSMFLVYV